MTGNGSSISTDGRSLAFITEASNLVPGDTNGLDDIVVRQQHAATNDFDGDSKADVAVFRPSNGAWYIINSSTCGVTRISRGTSGDVPLKSLY